MTKIVDVKDIRIGESFSWMIDEDGDVRETLGVSADGYLILAKKGLTQEQQARWERILGPRDGGSA